MVSFSSLLNIWFLKKNYDFLVFYAEYTLILTSLFRQTIDVQYIMFLSDWCLKNYGQYWSVYVSNFSVALSIIYKFLEDLHISQEVFSRPSQYHAMHSIRTDCGLLNILKNIHWFLTLYQNSNIISYCSSSYNRGDLYQIVHLKNWVGVHFTNWHLTLGSWWSWSFLACINFLEMKSSVYEDVGKYSNFNAKFGDFFFSIIFWRTKYYVYNFKFNLMGNLLTIHPS